VTSDATPQVPDVVRAFEERRTLTGSLSHREHVMIAWHYARTRPAPQALAELARGIQELAVALGKEGLYHETLTWGWFSVIRERMERLGVGATWEEFAAASEDILSGRALDAYYDRSVLASDLARRVFLMPAGGPAVEPPSGRLTAPAPTPDRAPPA
jgi:N-formylglutamate deformylase